MKTISKNPRGLVSNEYKKQPGFKGSKKKFKHYEKHENFSKNQTITSSVNEKVGELLLLFIER